MLGNMTGPSGEGAGGVGDSNANAGIGAAATDVAVHRRVDFGGGRRLAAWVRFEEGDCAHDLATLTVAALRHVVLDPCGMHGSTDAVGAIGHGFDRGELLAFGFGNRRDAGADGLAVQMHRTSAAPGGARAE